MVIAPLVILISGLGAFAIELGVGLRASRRSQAAQMMMANTLRTWIERQNNRQDTTTLDDGDTVAELAVAMGQGPANER